ncbi:YkgJ family cysteine cluster protein [Lentisphaera profundi]|uniref:YkgJ family cysteine cluster protein n=1 Tax=Lentisphaera profundi TaxID=1658616 RepID=A0ABY7VYF4_9BACT|nr:YkgJ family cysteine cluster protein [Lentisphaera profundi]WDE98824.1 YkgJ family cysteine cluster protein [Lentisphaera profundi]
MAIPENKEQELCKNCGFCCDGTLFTRAVSFKDEILLPKMETEIIDDSYWFKQPCSYFDQSCTVYEQKRPDICGDFKCRLLKKFTKGQIDFDELETLIHQLKVQKTRLYKLIPDVNPNDRLQDAFNSFLEKNKTPLESKAFKIKHSQLLLEWALYQERLSSFHQ